MELPTLGFSDKIRLNHSCLALVAQRTVINKKMAEPGVNMW
jgi:hypothetical protein